MAAAARKEPGEGHNSGIVESSQLKSIVERIERLNEDKAAVAEDIKEVFAEAKGNGFDTKVLRKLVSLRAKDKAKLLEENAILDLYASALGCSDLV